MARSDWGDLSGGIASGSLHAGATAGTAPPLGGGTHVYGMSLADSVAGAAGLYCLTSNFSPIAGEHGGRITGAVRRATVGASTGFAPFLFFGATGATVGATAYMLGLSDEAASHIQLRKGALSAGLAAVTAVAPATAPNVLMQSTNTFAPDSWQHLRLDIIVQGTGDVILQVYRNDCTVNAVTSPIWVPVPGMEGPFTSFSGYVDDALAVNTGSAPLLGGYAGFGARFEVPGRVAFFDQISIDRQLS